MDTSDAIRLLAVALPLGLAMTARRSRHTFWLIYIAVRCTCDPIFWSRPVLAELWGSVLRDEMPDFGRFEE